MDEHQELGGARIAFVQSCWHREIVDRSRDAFLATVAEAGMPEASVDLFEVPGAFEIPLQVQRLARTGRYAAIATAGLVVDGGIYRHEFVAEAVISGLMRVQLDTGVPVLSGVLTPQQFHEHDEHRSFFKAHFEVKGRELASACLATMRTAGRLRERLNPTTWCPLSRDDVAGWPATPSDLDALCPSGAFRRAGEVSPTNCERSG